MARKQRYDIFPELSESSEKLRELTGFFENQAKSIYDSFSGNGYMQFGRVIDGNLVLYAFIQSEIDDRFILRYDPRISNSFQFFNFSSTKLKDLSDYDSEEIEDIDYFSSNFQYKNNFQIFYVPKKIKIHMSNLGLSESLIPTLGVEFCVDIERNKLESMITMYENFIHTLETPFENLIDCDLTQDLKF